jgi:hypothetical protein
MNPNPFEPIEQAAVVGFSASPHPSGIGALITLPGTGNPFKLTREARDITGDEDCDGKAVEMVLRAGSLGKYTIFFDPVIGLQAPYIYRYYVEVADGQYALMASTEVVPRPIMSWSPDGEHFDDLDATDAVVHFFGERLAQLYRRTKLKLKDKREKHLIRFPVSREYRLVDNYEPYIIIEQRDGQESAFDLGGTTYQMTHNLDLTVVGLDQGEVKEVMNHVRLLQRQLDVYLNGVNAMETRITGVEYSLDSQAEPELFVANCRISFTQFVAQYIDESCWEPEMTGIDFDPVDETAIINPAPWDRYFLDEKGRHR